MNPESDKYEIWKIAEKNNNTEAIKLLIREIERKDERKTLPDCIMRKSKRGYQGNLNFNVRIAKI